MCEAREKTFLNSDICITKRQIHAFVVLLCLFSLFPPSSVTSLILVKLQNLYKHTQFLSVGYLEPGVLSSNTSSNPMCSVHGGVPFGKTSCIALYWFVYSGSMNK